MDLQVSLVITKSCYPVPDCGASLRHECLIFTFESYILLNQYFRHISVAFLVFPEWFPLCILLSLHPPLQRCILQFLYFRIIIYSLIFVSDVSYQNYSFPQSEYVPFYNFERVNPLSFQSSRIQLEFIFQ